MSYNRKEVSQITKKTGLFQIRMFCRSFKPNFQNKTEKEKERK
jgi:hypothetical protein